MKTLELLAPAGTMEALHAAVHNGCDAVYLGGSAFGARAFAGNFNNQEIIEAIEYAHLYGVKVYVTMNTLVYEHEIDDAVAYAYFLYQHDVDALIIQDIGLFHRLQLQLPDLELHASTQMHIHNEDGIEMIKRLGGKRVVLPRESTIEDIKRLTNCGVDIEVFVHGALCVGYSGQCLMSFVLFGRSGNRGECAQPCRMKYQLMMKENGKLSKVGADGEYLLSPKDLNTIEQIGELITAGVTSFKIEGRMKRPEYVAQIVSLYRYAIDQYINKQSFHLSKQQEQNMLKVFNRGFTTGHLFHQYGRNLMNPLRPNHMGIEVGKVVKATSDNITIHLSERLHQGDGIRILGQKEDQGQAVNKIYNMKGLLIKEAGAKEDIILDHKGFVEKGSIVLKTSDSIQLKELQESYTNHLKKIKISAEVFMEVGKPLSMSIKDHEGHVCRKETGDVVTEAISSPLDENKIKSQIMKTGDTAFEIEHVHIRLQGKCFISLKQINQMRRDILKDLEDQRKKRYVRGTIKPYEFTINPIFDCKDIVIVQSLEQFEACEPSNLMIATKNKKLYQHLIENGKQINFHEGRVIKRSFMNGLMSGEIGGVVRGCKMADASFNITNSYSAAYVFAQGIETIVLSTELTISSVKDIINGFHERYGRYGAFLYKGYGYTELMISEYCAVNTCLRNDKKNCSLCRNNKRYYLQDVKGMLYPLMNDEDCRMHILHHEPINHLQFHHDTSYKMNYVIEFTVETKEQTQHILNMIRDF